MISRFRILVLNGPNLNMLGIRETDKYDSLSLNEIIECLNTKAKFLNVKLDHIQSNSECVLIESIHQSRNNIDYILINPSAFTHTSVAIRDALLAVSIPFIEIHISNVYAREPFRHYSYFSDIASGIICGMGIDGYLYALQIAVKRLLHSTE